VGENGVHQPGGGAQVTGVYEEDAVRGQDLWQRTVDEVAEEHPDVKADHADIDAACMWMVKNPEWFDVAVTPNLFGDIITDLGAMIQGGMGMAASGNIHPGKVSLFEPIHGSAPKHAGKNVASPIAAIMATSMMFDYLGEKKAAAAVDQAIADCFADGRLKAATTGAHPTNEVGDLIAAELRKSCDSRAHDHEARAGADDVRRVGAGLAFVGTGDGGDRVQRPASHSRRRGP